MSSVNVTKSFKLAVYSKGGVTAEKLALVLPGKLDTKDYSHMRGHVDYLADKGYLAVSFDPPGTWESPGGIKLYTMTNYLRAVDELIDYYGNKPTFVMGHSRGATIATIAGARNEQVFAFAVVMSSFSKGSLQRETDIEWKTRGFAVSKRDLPPGGGAKVKKFIVPYSFFEDQKKYDLSEDITTSTKPKLFILGKHDDLIPSEKIRKTFKSFGEPKVLRELDSGHDYRHHPHLIGQVNDCVGDFLSSFR